MSIFTVHKMLRFEPPNSPEDYGALKLDRPTLPSTSSTERAMSSRSFESSASSKDSTEDCLKVRLGKVLAHYPI